MKKLVSLRLLCMLILSGNLINAAPEEAENIAIKTPPTKEQINQHNADMLARINEAKPEVYTAVQIPKTSQQQDHNFVLIPNHSEPTPDNFKGGINFKPSSITPITGSNGATAKITTNDQGKIVKTVITHPETSILKSMTNSLGITKPTSQTTIEHHEDGTHTITTSSNVNNGLFKSINYTTIEKSSPDGSAPLRSNVTTENSFGKPIKTVKVHETGKVVTTNADGSRTEKTEQVLNEDTEDASRQFTRQTFDANGNLTGEIITNADSDKEPIKTTKIITNHDGSITKLMHINNADGTKTTRLTNKDDQTITEETTDPKNNNRLIKRITLVGEGDAQKRNIFEMNHATNETTYTTMNHDGSSKSRTTNAKNITIKSTVIDIHGKKTETANDEDGELKQETITDKDGNKIKEVAVNKDTDPVTTTTTKYDTTGNPTSIEIIHEGNQATGKKPYTTTQEFKGNGKSITTTRDSHGDITTTASTQIDPLNAKSITTVKDAAGKLIKTVTITNKGTDQETQTTVHDGGSTIVESFNAKGIKTKSVINGQYTSTTTDYDATGKFKKEVVVDRKGDTLTETAIDPTTGERITTRHEIKDDIEKEESDEKDENGRPLQTIITNKTAGQTTTVELNTNYGEKTTTTYDNRYGTEPQHTLITDINDDTKKFHEETTVNGIKTTDKYNNSGVKQSSTVEGPAGKFISHTEYQEDGTEQSYDENMKPIDSTPSSPRSTATNF